MSGAWGARCGAYGKGSWAKGLLAWACSQILFWMCGVKSKKGREDIVRKVALGFEARRSCGKVYMGSWMERWFNATFHDWLSGLPPTSTPRVCSSYRVGVAGERKAPDTEFLMVRKEAAGGTSTKVKWLKIRVQN